MEAHHRRRPHARRRCRGASGRRHRSLQSRRPRPGRGRGSGGASHGTLFECRPLRARVAFRGLRNGVCRGDRPWLAGGRDHGRCYPGNGADERWPAGAGRRCRRAHGRAAAPHRGFHGAPPSCGGSASGGGRASDVAAFGRTVLAGNRGCDVKGFSVEWLTLREPYDARARNPAVLDAVVASLKRYPSIRIVDLACGTGSTLRALAPRLPVQQNWRLADNYLILLARASSLARPAGVTVTAVPLDLNRDLEAALDGPIDLITASALLDLVSEAWLERLVIEIAARSIPLYAALSYDGRVELGPTDPFDAAIVAAVNAHQCTDKGFGPALGPMATSFTIARFESLGYSVIHGASDWVIGTDNRDIQMEIFAGWASAVRELGDLSLADTVGWLTRRRDAVAARRSSIRVGHVDVFARPMGTR